MLEREHTFNKTINTIITSFQTAHEIVIEEILLWIIQVLLGSVLMKLVHVKEGYGCTNMARKKFGFLRSIGKSLP